MNQSTPITDLLTALCATRLDFPTITCNATGFSKRTGQKYQYADISAIIDGTAPILCQHGLVLVQALEDGEAGTLRITSPIFHASSGQCLSADLSVEKPASMQDFGSVATYAKRYAMQALLNISTEEDDDAAEVGATSPPASSGSQEAALFRQLWRWMRAAEPDNERLHQTLARIQAWYLPDVDPHAGEVPEADIAEATLAGETHALIRRPAS